MAPFFFPFLPSIFFLLLCLVISFAGINIILSMSIVTIDFIDNIAAAKVQNKL